MKKWIVAALFVVITTSSANAQIARVFLGGTGDDANDCSQIETPCRSLQAAVNQCPVNGEVIVISSGGFGSANITKSLTVDAAPGVLAFNARSIGVSIAPTATVTLRHLVLNGVFGDLVGVDFVNGGTLNIENCDISGYAHYGVFQLAAGSSLRVKDSSIHDTLNGIYGAPPSGPGTKTITLSHCHLHNIVNLALWAYASAIVTVNDTRFSNNSNDVAAYSQIASATTTISINRSMFSNATQSLTAFGSDGGIALIYLSSSSMNGVSLTHSSSVATGGLAKVISFGNNALTSNGSAPPFDLVLALK
jgi:hypothetical protein